MASSLYDPMAALRDLESSQGDREHIFEQSRFRIPATFQFDNVTFDIGAKSVLSDVSGYAAPGHVLAIMGPSGAGKTSLLDMLAGRVGHISQEYTVTGSIKVNGEQRDFDAFRTISAYVLQSDNFFPELTVRETIMLSALLRLPKDMPLEKKVARVSQVRIC